MSKQSFKSSYEDEISLKDIIDFLIESWKTIVIPGLLGVLISGAALIATPNQYQATAQIQMAHIGVSNNTGPLGVNVEDPNLLLARLRMPSTFSVDVIKTCGFNDSKVPAEDLLNAAKFQTVSGVNSIIELRVNSDSKKVAISCVQGLFEIIKTSQNQIIKPYIEESRALLIKYEARLAIAQSLIAKADKSDVFLSAFYLTTRDEIKFLTQEIFRLNSFIISADARQTSLTSPIYAADIPLPKKKRSLIVGLMAGLFLGLLFVMGKKALKTYKDS